MTKKLSLTLFFLFSGALNAAELYISGKKQNITIDAFTYDGNRLDITPKSTSSGGSSGGSGGGSSGGGVAGNDPGLGQKWVTSYQGKKVFVADRSAFGNRTYWPGCISKKWSAMGLNHSHSLNPFAASVSGCRGTSSLRTGEIYSQRLPFKKGTKAFSIKLGPAEAGEGGIQPFDIAISSTPGQLDPTEFPTNGCSMKNVSDGSISLISRDVWQTLSSRSQSRYCPIEENTLYYFNFRLSSGTTGCGIGSGKYVCRAQIIDYILPTYYQDQRVQDEKY